MNYFCETNELSLTILVFSAFEFHNHLLLYWSYPAGALGMGRGRECQHSCYTLSNILVILQKLRAGQGVGGSIHTSAKPSFLS
jgi:hypothetical protein